MTKGNPLRTRIIVLFAVVSLLLIGAAPVSAGPGGVPGPPEGHDKAKEKEATEDGETNGPPSWAKAYGKRIQDEFGLTYGQLQQCDRANEDAGDGSVEPSEEPTDCPADLEFPEDERGAKAFWVFTEAGLAIVAI